MGKGAQTRQQILDVALDAASRCGLEGITIGQLAESCGMSKSGLFAHFRSREDLQLAILDTATAQFVAAVLHPALSEKRGIQRLRAIVTNWFKLQRGEARRACIFLSGSTEYDDRPGPLRDAIADLHRQWRRDLSTSVQHAIDLRQLEASTDPEQVAFEIFALVMALHHDRRLLDDTKAHERAIQAFERMLRTYGAKTERSS